MRPIEKGATYLDKLCQKLHDEPKGRGFQVDGKCRRCGGPLMTYYCEDRLHLIACEKCGTLALTKAVSPQVAANLTLRQPTLTPPNEPLTIEQLKKMDGKFVYLVSEKYGISEWNIPTGMGEVVLAYDRPFVGLKAVVPGIKFINGREFCVDTYGDDWITYRRPPEGEEEP